jgi:hypothetical protein
MRYDLWVSDDGSYGSGVVQGYSLIGVSRSQLAQAIVTLDDASDDERMNVASLMFPSISVFDYLLAQFPNSTMLTNVDGQIIVHTGVYE